MKKFGKAATNDAAAEKHLVVKSEEDVPIEISRKLAVQASVKDEAEEKFYEESLAMAENMNQQKKAWTEINRLRQVERDEGGNERPAEPDKPSDLRASAEAAKAGDPTKPAYVPPSLRGKGENDPKGKGKGGDFSQQQEASLRVTNLAEDVREGDLQDLFGQVGRLQRVYLAKDQTTGASRGFAFITYYTREDAQRAIDRLNGHGYDNLILQVQFAKPRQCVDVIRGSALSWGDVRGEGRRAARLETAAQPSDLQPALISARGVSCRPWPGTCAFVSHLVSEPEAPSTCRRQQHLICMRRVTQRS